MSPTRAPSAGLSTADASGDFSALLRRQSGSGFVAAPPIDPAHRPVETHATTVLSFHYEGGVVIAGDRRATAGNIVMYDRADKVIELDGETVMAIAGSPAVAFEMARTLQTSFQYYRRSQPASR